MCKLSLIIVPNVYNSLQSSFLSLAWPWWGRLLPKGNQWEWWDPQQGPLPGLGEVGHSSRGTSMSAGTLDWGLMWSGSQSTWYPYKPPIPAGPWPLHSLPAPNAPLTPLTPLMAPLMPPTPPDTPHPCQWEYWDHGLGSSVVGLIVHLPLLIPSTPCCPQCPLHPTGPLMPPSSPQHSLNPCWWDCRYPGLGTGQAPSPPATPNAPTPHYALHPCWPLTPKVGGIMWPRVVLHQATLTFGQHLGQTDLLMVNSLWLIWVETDI